MPAFDLTDDEIRLVREINDKYRTADDGAHKDFRTKSDRYYSLYRGVREWHKRLDGVDRRDRDIAYREGQDRWGTELFIPYAYRTVETVIPRMLSNRPRMLFTPWDEQALGNVNKMRMLVDRQQEQFTYELIVQDVAKDGLIYGLGVQKTGWKKEYRKISRVTPGIYGDMTEQAEPTCVIDDAWVWRVEPLDFLWDPYAAEIDECEYLIHRTWRSDQYVKRMVELGQENGGWRNDIPIDDLLSLGGADRRSEVFGDRLTAEGSSTSNPQGGKVHEVWEFHDRDQVITILDREVPVRVTPNPTASGDYPFQVYRPTKVGGRFVGIGEIEPIEDLQYEINDLRSQRRDAAAFALMQVYAYDDSVIDSEDLRGGIFPGAAIPVNGQPRDFIYPIPFKEPPGTSYQEEAAIRGDMDTTSGVSDTVTGGDGGGPAAQTATGVQLVQAAAGERIKAKGRRAEVELCKAAGQQLLLENQRRITSDRMIPMENHDAGPSEPAWRLVKVGPNELAGRMSVQVEGGSMAAENTPQMRSDAQAWVQFMGTPLGQFVDPQWAAKKVVELMGVKDPEGVVKPPVPQAPLEAVAAWMQQNGLPPEAMQNFEQFLQGGPDGAQGPQNGPPQQSGQQPDQQAA